MEVILLERVPNLGQLGQVVKVKPGYARNFLLPTKKALRATKENLAYFERQKEVIVQTNAERRQSATEQGGKVDGVSWIRLHYTFPSAFDDELIDAIASEPKVVKYVDVPLQHIADPMLKRMRRGHSARVTRELVTKLRARIDDLVLRTTFIVGHPGETDAEFDELCAFVGTSKFDRAGAFTYSIEPGTVSAMLPNRVDPDVAGARQQKLMEIQRQISRARHDAMVGKKLDVLVEGVSSESEYLLEGRWYGQAPGIDGVTFLSSGADGPATPGMIVRARVTQGADYDLAATLIG